MAAWLGIHIRILQRMDQTSVDYTCDFTTTQHCAAEIGEGLSCIVGLSCVVIGTWAEDQNPFRRKFQS